MHVIDYFTAMAARAEGALRRLVDEQNDKTAQKNALGDVETALEQMAADGLIDEREMEALGAMLRARKMDPGAIEALYRRLRDEDGTVRATPGSRLTAAIRGAVEDRRAELETSVSDLHFELQVGVENYAHGTQMASTLMKAEHDAAMTAIRNIG